MVWLRNNYGKKPIWLTEWGVSAGGGAESNSAACLGMADVFLFMSENQDAYDRANWFSFNRALNPMVLVVNRKPAYPLKKRGYLMAYELVYDVMFDGIMYETNMSTQKITNTLGTMNAVNARVVTKKDGSTNVIVVNLSDKSVEFELKFNGTTIPLTATATDANGTIEKVNFFINDVFSKSDLTAPFESTFSTNRSGRL